jgi:DNA polymerase III subunit alpha
MSFFHVHCHSDFSVLDALLKVDEAAKMAAELDQPALALTDHGTMAGMVQHYQACRKNDIIPIMGLEGYMVENAGQHPDLVKSETIRINSEARKAGERKQVTNVQREAANQRRHVLLWARDFAGYTVLCHAMTKAYAQGYYKPLLDLADLAEIGRSGKVMMSTGCISGEVPRLLLAGNVQAAWERLNYYRNIFGDNYVVELQFHGLQDVSERFVNETLCRWATHLGMPLICTGDVHYLRASDQDIHSFYKQMANQNGYGGDGYHLQSTPEMRDRFPSTMWEMASTGLEHVLESVKNISFPDLDSYSYAVPKIVKTNPDIVLSNLTSAALRRLDRGDPDLYESRLALELKVIEDTEFAQYFLFVRSIVKFCEDNDIFFVARGSASGSLVCYLLGITQLDPIRYQLLFERFLSNDRSKPPDIDLDVEDERRDEVLRYISQRFETTQIGTVLTYQSKSTQNGVLEQVRRQFPQLANLDDDQLLALDAVQVYIKGIGGLAKSIGGHPAGVVAETPGKSIRDLVPLFYISSSERWVTQYDMDDIEALGIVKVDILGVRSLRVIRRNLEHMGKKNWDWIPNDDPATFQLLQSGETEGVFTFKGWSNKKGCKLLKPRTLDDCSLVAAIWRPSCLELGLEQLFLDRRKARWKPPVEWHPAIGKNLASTYGIAVYQEQVIMIMKAFGFTPDEVMVLLRAVKKKDPKLMAVIHKRLNELVDAETAKHVWELMEGYTRYGFNKSHSVAYALVGYRMAYLKANHPLEFMCAILECETEKTSQTMYMREARRMGLQILPVDVLSSGVTWTIQRNSLRRGLTSVTGVGEKAARALVQARPYQTIDELREKVNGPQCNIGVLKKLAEAGAFLSMGIQDEMELTQRLT